MSRTLEEVCARQKNDVIKQYVAYVVNVQADERAAGKSKLLQMDHVQHFLSAFPTERYLAAEVVQLLDDAESWRPMEMSRAFDALEVYTLNLVDYSWKNEYHTILTYSGYFKTQVESFIGDPCRLLQTIGYSRTPDHKLKLLRGVPERPVLIRAAFDFFLAATECRTINTIVTTLQQPQPNSEDVYRYRRNNASDVLQCIKKFSSVVKTGANWQSEIDVETMKQLINNLGKVAHVPSPVMRLNTEPVAVTERNSELPYGSPAQTIVPAQPVSTEVADVPDKVLPSKVQTGSSFSTFGKAPTRSPLDLSGKDVLAPSTQQSHFRKNPGDQVDSSSRASLNWDKQDKQIIENLMKSGRNVGSYIDDTKTVDQLVLFLKDLDPMHMEDVGTRRAVLSHLEEQSSSSLRHRGSLTSDDTPNKPVQVLVGRGQPASTAAKSEKL